MCLNLQCPPEGELYNNVQKLRCHTNSSGVKTPEEYKAFLSCLKAHPTNLTILFAAYYGA
jgi:hypothetical protein